LSRPRLLLGFYGDDFTGSTDVMEALALSGVKTRLFLVPPTPEQVARFSDLEAVGVAGLARSMSPAEMDGHLPPVFRSLSGLNPAIVHYKICTTFDSSPTVGSIGHATEIGSAVLPGPFVPLLVGAPVLGRYCVFGNLFARSGGDSDVFRLDRHPTMRHHPVTPMDEADLRLHLGKQTARPIRLFDARKYDLDVAAQGEALRSLVGTDAPILLFDVLSDSHLAPIGHHLWHSAGERPLFVVGSSGVEYALTAYWRQAGRLTAAPATAAAAPVDRLLTVSGSCSPVTARQIDRACAEGTVELPLTPEQLLGDGPRESRLGGIVDEAARLLSAGKSVLLHTCRGPDDPRVPEVAARLKQRASRGDPSRPGELLGTTLGWLLLQVLSRTGLRRAAVTGGDTSGYVAQAMGIESLSFVAKMAPGSPLCRIDAPHSPIDGIEMVFKGGQVGRDAFFHHVAQGFQD
jgi:uncharacterized protein YgbK (DUF1537 family)